MNFSLRKYNTSGVVNQILEPFICALCNSDNIFSYICIMYGSVKHIIPPEYRKRGIIVALTILLRAILNFFGIAMLVPLLTVILDAENIAIYPVVGNVYGMFHSITPTHFALCMAVGVVMFIIIKSFVNLFLYRYERDYIYNLYGYLSRQLYVNYYARGYAFVKDNNSAELSRNAKSTFCRMHSMVSDFS